jgi:hypothetical protein
MVVAIGKREKRGVDDKPYIFRSYPHVARNNPEQANPLIRNPGNHHELDIGKIFQISNS